MAQMLYLHRMQSISQNEPNLLMIESIP